MTSKVQITSSTDLDDDMVQMTISTDLYDEMVQMTSPSREDTQKAERARLRSSAHPTLMTRTWTRRESRRPRMTRTRTLMTSVHDEDF